MEHTSSNKSDTDDLLQLAGDGDESARSQLLAKHRDRLRQMISVRMDRRLMNRVDPSDIVQDVLLKANQRLSEYAQSRPLPFYPWLRQFAWDRLIELQRFHIKAQRRSVLRECCSIPPLPDESALQLIGRICSEDSRLMARMERDEVCRMVQLALSELSDNDREILILRHLERLSTAEIAAIQKISEGAVYTRHLRALQRLSKQLHKHLRRETS